MTVGLEGELPPRGLGCVRAWHGSTLRVWDLTLGELRGGGGCSCLGPAMGGPGEESCLRMEKVLEPTGGTHLQSSLGSGPFSCPHKPQGGEFAHMWGQ